MLSDLGIVTKQAYRWGVPVLAMAYVRNNAGNIIMDSNKILHSARSAADLGVEAVKIPFVPSDVIRSLISTVPVEVVVGGGVKQDEGPFLDHVRQIITAGASGVCIGRNFFQSANPTAFIAKLKHILRDPEAPFSEEVATRCA
jgi:DhnA family fructose-bisphosphate aldolase class Ia